MPLKADYWDPRNPIQKADRLRFHQRRRWVCGLHLDEDLSALHGCLLQGQGAGKALKIAPVKSFSQPIPDAVRQLIAEAHAKGLTKVDTANGAANQAPITLPWLGNCDLETLHAIQDDLSLIAESLIIQLMAAAGKASDQILAACISDPGMIPTCEDRIRLLPLLDSESIAFRTGLNLIDQLPNKDLLGGGQGWPINALALWMIWGDRSHPAAKETRLILDCRTQFLATLLPPSDGLDAEFPSVVQHWLPGMAVLRGVNQRPATSVVPEHRVKQWREIYPSKTVPMHHRRWNELKQATAVFSENLPQNSDEQHNVLAAYWIQSIEHLLSQNNDRSEGFRVIVIGDSAISDKVVQRVRETCPNARISTAEEFHCCSQQHEAIVAATLGFLHIDQMPCNLPWITGTDLPRILGRLIPGSPSRYRSLLVEMSDYRPPVMKLREAV